MAAKEKAEKPRIPVPANPFLKPTVHLLSEELRDIKPAKEVKEMSKGKGKEKKPKGKVKGK